MACVTLNFSCTISMRMLAHSHIFLLQRSTFQWNLRNHRKQKCDTAYSEWIKTTNSVSETCNSLGHWEYRVKWVGVKDEHPLYLANCVQFLLGDQILRKLLCFLWMWGTHVNIFCVFFSQENLPKYANILGLILNISPDYLQVFLRKYISNCRKNNLL